MIKQDQSSQQPRTTAKKPYHKPSFKSERVFETMALTCGKVQTTQQSCRGFSRKNS